MIEGIIKTLDGNTAKAIAVILVGFSLYVIKEVWSHVISKLKNFDSTVKDSISSFNKSFDSMKALFNKSSEEIANHQREMNANTVMFKTDLMKTQIEVNQEINKTKIGMVKLNQNFEILSSKLENYSKEISASSGKIIYMDRHINKHAREISSIIKTIETVKEDYGKVKLVAEKGKMSAEEAKQIAKGHSATVQKIEAILARGKEKKGKNGV